MPDAVVSRGIRASAAVRWAARELSGRALARPLGLGIPLALLVIAVVAFLRAYRIETSYELFIDEITYARISEAVADDGAVDLYGRPFYLHPPLYFLLQGAVISIFGLDRDVFPLVDGLRLTNVVFAAGIGVLVLRIVTRMAGTGWGVAAAAAFALNTFIVRFDSRVMLETTTVFWVVLGYAALLPLVGHGREALRGAARWRAIGGGLAFGLALLTKETSAPLYVLPLAWCVAFGAPLPRRVAGLSLGTAVVAYLPYPITAVAVGHGSAYVDEKFGGVLRMVGLRQETGFNAEGTPSFLSRIVANLDLFAVTYGLIGIGLLVAVVLWRRGTPPQRLLLLWMLSALAMLSYQVSLGTLEEQMFYLLVVPALITIAAVGGAALSGRRHPPGRRRALLALAAVLGLTVLALDGSAWWRTHHTRDDGFAQTISWLRDHAPEGSRVEALADSSEFLLEHYEVAVDRTIGDVMAARPHFLITSSAQTEQGYGRARAPLVRWLPSYARPVHRVTTRTSGTLTVWRTAQLLPLAPTPGAVR